MLCATTACNFSSLIWPAGTCRFSQPTFRPSGATNHWENTVFRDFATFSRTWIFFLLGLSLFWSSFFFSSLLFSSLLFSDSSHLCFSSVHIVGSLTSKLPSIILHTYYFVFLYFYMSLFNFIFFGLFPYLSIKIRRDNDSKIQQR